MTLLRVWNHDELWQLSFSPLTCPRARILEYRDESQRLDQCARLYDASALKRSFDNEAATVRQVRRRRASVDRVFHSIRHMLGACITKIGCFARRLPRQPSKAMDGPLVRIEQYPSFLPPLSAQTQPPLLLCLPQFLCNTEMNLCQLSAWIAQTTRFLLPEPVTCSPPPLCAAVGGPLSSHPHRAGVPGVPVCVCQGAASCYRDGGALVPDPPPPLCAHRTASGGRGPAASTGNILQASGIRDIR